MNLDDETAKEIKSLGWPPFPFRAEIDYDYLMFPIEGWVMGAHVATVSLGSGRPKFRVKADVMTDQDVPEEYGETREISVWSSAVRPLNALDRFIEGVNRE